MKRHKPESKSKVYYQTKIDELGNVLHYLEERLLVIQQIHEGAIKLGDRQDLIIGTENEAARLVQLIKTMENHIALSVEEMKSAF